MKELCDKAKKWYVVAPCCWCSPTGISLKSPAGSGSDGGWRDPDPSCRESLRCDANIIVETASARDPHTSPCCWVSARRLFIHTLPMNAGPPGRHPRDCQRLSYRDAHYRNGINKGLYKIMSKMGISPSPLTAARNCLKRSVCTMMSGPVLPGGG